MENQASKESSSHCFSDCLSREETRCLFLERAQEVSQSPGVYLMKAQDGAVLYIGKAKNLKNRLVTYFQPTTLPIPRIALLIQRLDHFDVILTETETEALILECTLIKKHKPPFNVQLKDDKAYPYLRIQSGEAIPRIEWVRRVRQDGARYFGPFPSVSVARQVVGLLNATFKLRDCSDNTFRHRSRPCILFQMQKCSAPCVEKISPKQYHESLEQVIEVLEGKTDQLIQSLRKGMEDAALREEFEQAAVLRDQIKNLERVTETQMADEAGSYRNRDVIGIARIGGVVHAVLLQVRAGRMVAVRHYNLQNTDASLADAEILFEFLGQYYVLNDVIQKQEETIIHKNFGLELTRPKEVLVPFSPSDPDLLERTISLGIRVAENEGDHRILQVAKANAEYALERVQNKSGGQSILVLEEIQKKLHLLKLPNRIECFDISNIQGEDAAASRVVFIDGVADKNLYRRYKIHTVSGPDDFAMMKEVLSRRFSNFDEALPDLVVVDGGKGQLAQAVTIFKELGIEEVGVVGLAKARVSKNFKSKEIQASLERIFIPNRKNPVPLRSGTESYKLLVQIRDEAHRFAISYHRILHNKRSLKSL